MTDNPSMVTAHAWWTDNPSVVTAHAWWTDNPSVVTAHAWWLFVYLIIPQWSQHMLGGCSCILFGDFGQLPLVLDLPLYTTT